MTHHSPGPWEYDKPTGTVNQGDLLIHENTDWGDGRTDEELAANARLIAAAPDLLAICQKFLEVEPDFWLSDESLEILAESDFYLSQAFDAMKAAVAKATSPQSREAAGCKLGQEGEEQVGQSRL